MKKNSICLTTAQFAKLHEVNKRTLHYYDSIGLFCPHTKGDNGYRYYNISQSVEFEYIRMLKKLNMSIEEIRAYLRNPAPEKFMEIVQTKETEVDMEIKKLQHMKKILQAKKEQVNLCESLQEHEIRIAEQKAEKIIVLPYDFMENDISQLFTYVKEAWSIEQIQTGIGSFISLDKVMNNNFEVYDGIYTIALSSSSSSKYLIKPKGKYLCGYSKGTWDKLPVMYKNMVDYAKKNDLKLTGYAYELGLNEFVISDPEKYITKIMIKIDE